MAKIDHIKKATDYRQSTRFPHCATIFIVILILGISVFTIMIAIKSIKQPYAYYGTSCANNPCQNNLGLQCIDNQCQCGNHSFYLNNCIIKKSKSEKCHYSSAVCDDSKHLSCHNGLCDCDTFSYWNNSYCYPKKTYKGPCKSDIHCLTNELLYCNAIQTICICSDD